MSSKTCGHCDKHIWSDNEWEHICQRNGDFKQITETCELYRLDKRGTYGCDKHENIFDLARLEGSVKDDKYTRKGGNN